MTYHQEQTVYAGAIAFAVALLIGASLAWCTGCASANAAAYRHELARCSAAATDWGEYCACERAVDMKYGQTPTRCP